MEYQPDENEERSNAEQPAHPEDDSAQKKATPTKPTLTPETKLSFEAIAWNTRNIKITCGMCNAFAHRIT